MALRTMKNAVVKMIIDTPMAKGENIGHGESAALPATHT